MDFQTAINTLASKSFEDKTELIDAIYTFVEPLCATDTEGEGDTTQLWDWLYSGDYYGNETPESIASEWDELSEAVED